MEVREIDRINIDRLIEGYQYSYLPEGLLFGGRECNIATVALKLLNNESQYCYKMNDNLINIEKFGGMSSPSYIYSFGSEPIGFFDFKKNGSYREIQIPNLIFYIVFIYNSINSSEDIFNKIYKEDNDFIKYSNSYTVFEKQFIIHNSYDETDEEISCGEFAPRNNKTINQLTTENKALKYLEKMSSKLFVLKIDIESFYPNIYTHLLSNIKNKKPYNDLISNNNYFDFLDKYNMKVSSNQTKGILAGTFSSNIASELLMLCVDYEIANYIKDLNVEYIRYVDDFTFFSDSKEQLQEIVDYVQKVLNQYKLRINHTKTEIKENVLFVDSLDFNSIDHDFELIKEFWTSHEAFIQLKEMFKAYLELGKISELKVILSRITRKIKKGKFEFDLFEIGKMSKYMVNYILQLIFYDTNLAVNCYRLLYELFKFYKESFLELDELIDCLCSKTIQINSRFSNTLIQIWHYYLLNQFGTIENKPKYYYELLKQTDNQNETVNPLVLVTFIENGDGKNKEIFDFIITEYSKNIDDADDWKRTIMLSKWWLPLLRIRMVDNKNYHGFYNSADYHPIWKDLSNCLDDEI